MTHAILDELVELTRELGDPAHDYAILGEGNTSARVDDDSFYVKASGAALQNIGPDGFVRVSRPRLVSMLDAGDLDDTEIRQSLEDAKIDLEGTVRPSVETLLHAVCMGCDNVRFVAHSHPTAVNIVTCSRAFDQALTGRLFPDEVVIGGARPLLVPYADPGLPLARAIRDGLRRFADEHDGTPRSILLQNHGLVALGRSAREALAITAMAVKAARVLAGTYALGGPRFLADADVERLATRPDERYRQRVLFDGDDHGAVD
jgi:rhamnose utilization protein RhaD (predicted bifunctional aldolase and dehydrogenase)